MTLQPQRLYSPERGVKPRRGGLLEWMIEIADTARAHPDTLEADIGGRFTFYRRGPYADDSAASEAAAYLRRYEDRIDCAIESFGKTFEGRSYAYARCVPREVELRIVRDVVQ